MRTVGRFFASTFSTAMSLVLSEPSTFALNSRWSESFTVTSFAFSTTCALVRITPSVLMMKPEPCARTGTVPPLRPARHVAEEEAERIVVVVAKRACRREQPRFATFCSPTIEMPTTAPWFCATMAR